MTPAPVRAQASCARAASTTSGARRARSRPCCASDLLDQVRQARGWRDSRSTIFSCSLPSAPRQDHLHRPQLPLPLRGAGHRASRDGHLLREVRERADAARAPPWRCPRLEPQGGLRGRGGVRDRQARQGRAGGAGARPRGGLHAVQRPVGARLPVQDAAVDAGQDLRRRRSVRSSAGERRRGRALTTPSRSSCG